MKRSTLWAAITLTMMAPVALTGCSSDSDNEKPVPIIDPLEPPTMDLTRTEKEMVERSNEFAFNLFRVAQDKKKSQILSPISITYALGMLNNGADGETLAQINRVLGFSNTGADGINAFCYRMLNAAPTLDPLTKVMIANNIYVNRGYELKNDFVQKAKVYYNAEPETRDFNDGRTMDVINQWASDHTEQMIKKVLDEDTFNPDAVSYLLNAIYFKGSWTKKFDKAMTVDDSFVCAMDEDVERAPLNSCPMMHQTATFEYAENDDYQALRLPYGNGSFRMTVLLPTSKANNSWTVPQVPTAEAWQQLNQKMDSTLVDVKIPRFETDTDIDLKNIMIKLGMKDAFDDVKADFRNFCNESVFIELMKQVAKIKLDEEGAEAAAVTVIGTNDKSIGLAHEYITFNANHPFLYVISEKKSDAVFFIGQYTGN
jgi:serpin B